jgi:hypothetical protein
VGILTTSNANNLKAILPIVEMTEKEARLIIKDALRDSLGKKPW